MSGSSGPLDASLTISAVRVGKVLAELCAEELPIGVSELSRNTGIGKAVVHRILKSLESTEIITMDPDSRTYSSGPVLIALGARAIREVDVLRVALPHLDELSTSTNETSTLSIRVHDRRACIAQVPGRHPIRFSADVGSQMPLYAGAASKAILAFMEPREIDSVLQSAPAGKSNLPNVAPVKLLVELERIRLLGYATSSEERMQGAASVAAPIFDIRGRVVASISVGGPAERFTGSAADSSISRVKEAAESISRELQGRANFSPAPVAQSLKGSFAK